MLTPMLDKKIQQFCHRYDARVTPDRSSWRRAIRSLSTVPISDNDSVHSEIHCQEQPMVRITLPQDRFQALVEHEQRVTDLVRPVGSYYSNIPQLVKQMEQECILRHSHPGLQAAWEQYQMLLRLVQ